MWDHLIVTLSEYRLGKMEVIGELLTLTAVSVPLHDVLPLLEDFHCMKLFVEGEVFQKVVLNTFCDVLLI